jgi:hypothetical protein
MEQAAIQLRLRDQVEDQSTKAFLSSRLAVAKYLTSKARLGQFAFDEALDAVRLHPPVLSRSPSPDPRFQLVSLPASYLSPFDKRKTAQT